MGRLFGVLESKWVARTLAVYSLVTFGALVVGLVYALAVGVIHGPGWVPLFGFGVWVLLAILLITALMVSRHPNTVASPASRLVISKGLPGSTRALVLAFERVEAAVRRLIAEAAILNPLDNQVKANELAQAFVELEAEVGALVANAAALDERWSLLWADKPRWADNQPSRALFSRERLDELVKYMAWRGGQLGSMIDFLITGNDDRVRHIRAWVKAREQERQEAEDSAARTATRRASPLS
jgi:hypothetical protein